MVFLSMYCVFISKRGHKKQENVKKKKKTGGSGELGHGVSQNGLRTLGWNKHFSLCFLEKNNWHLNFSPSSSVWEESCLWLKFVSKNRFKFDQGA